MKNLRRNLYTYSGRISFPNGAPSLFDIAVSLAREGRYAGAGMRWWPVALHTFVVCDMLPDAVKIHGLLHDSPECITGDVPKPVKTEAVEELEHRLTRNIYHNFGIAMPNRKEEALIKEADTKALCGEVYTVGTQALQSIYARCPEAEALVIKYLGEYPPMECINPDGRAAIEFMRRFRVYLDMMHVAEQSHVVYKEAYHVARASSVVRRKARKPKRLSAKAK